MIFFPRFSLLILLLFISGCSGNQNLESLFAPNSALTSSTKNENNSQTNTQQNSSQSTNSQTSSIDNLPDKFPDNIPVYPEAKIIKNEANKLELDSSDPANLIISFYSQNLQENNWQIEQNNDNLLIANLADKKQKLEVNVFPQGEITNFTLAYSSENEEFESNINTNQDDKNNQNQSNQNNISKSEPLEQLISLNIIENSSEIELHQTVTRREYARYLVKTNNLLFAETNSKKIRLANPNSQAIFSDINKNDPDFPYIQGLAEAGLIPSNLIQDSSATNFRPDAPLTREDLIAWKVPLDYRQNFPFASLDSIKETWGFQDVAKIDSQVWQELYVDWQNGENANIRRAFGYITLFQPEKPVTYEEVARVLNIFGYQGEIFSLNQVE